MSLTWTVLHPTRQPGEKTATSPVVGKSCARAQRQNPAGLRSGLRGKARSKGHILCATGGSVLDRPTTSVPGVDKGKDTQKKKPRFYRVMLHNDTFNKREYVVQVLLKVVKVITVDDAVNVMQEAHVNGLACVIACAQEEAEQYCEGLRNNGLIASIEPAGNGGGDGTA